MLRICLLFCSVLVLSGCGGGPNDTPSLGDVSGKVTYRDVPIAGISVIFTAVDGTSRSAQGTTNADGNYKLLFNSGNTGAALGKNSVQLKLAEAEEGDTEEGGKPSKANINDLPAIFLSPFTEFDVQPGTNTCDLKLETFE